MLAWATHFLPTSLGALEAAVAANTTSGTHCYGASVTLADAWVVPAVVAAKRFRVELDSYPTLLRVAESLSPLPAFSSAAPEAQPDAVSVTKS